MSRPTGHHPRKRMIQFPPKGKGNYDAQLLGIYPRQRLAGTLYVGVTNHLVRRVYEHRMGLADGFTKRYRVHRLVFYEPYEDVTAAISREKRLKKWNRAWKISLIETSNPNWVDLYPQIATA